MKITNNYNLAKGIENGQVSVIQSKSCKCKVFPSDIAMNEPAGRCFRNHFRCLDTSLRVDKLILEPNSSSDISPPRHEIASLYPMEAEAALFLESPCFRISRVSSRRSESNIFSVLLEILSSKFLVITI